MANIVLIDDHKLFREGVKKIIENEPIFKVVAEGDDGANALSLAEKFQPDIVLMDINMPNINGIQATKEITEQYPDIKVVILSVHDDESFVADAFSSGAKGYLLKEMDSLQLIEAIKTIADGHSYLHPKAASNLVQAFQKLTKQLESRLTKTVAEYRRPLHLLTRRECEVLQLLADGKSNRGVADTLFISEKTVKNHVSNILQKMSVNDRTQAVITAIRNGWVETR